MPKKNTARNAFREIHDGSTPPRYSIVAKSGAVLVAPTEANLQFPCMTDSETHALQYIDFTDDEVRYLSPAEVPADEIDYCTPFNVVPQGGRLFIIQEKTCGHPHNDKDRKYGFISIDLSSGQRQETGLCYAHAEFVCGNADEQYGTMLVASEHLVTDRHEIAFIGSMGLINDRLETLLEPRYHAINVRRLDGTDFAIVVELQEDRERFGLFNIHTRTWIADCQYDYIDVTSKYFLLIQGWLDYGREIDTTQQPLTRILDGQGRHRADIAFTTYYGHSDTKSDPDAFLFTKDQRWGKADINGVVLAQPQFENIYDVPDKDYVLSDIKLAHAANKRCVLPPEDLQLLQRLAADTPTSIKYEGTKLGPDGQAHLALLSIEGISFIAIDAEYEDFKLIVALQDTNTMTQGTVLVQRAKDKSLTTLAGTNIKLYNHLQNILAQAELLSTPVSLKPY